MREETFEGWWKPCEDDLIPLDDEVEVEDILNATPEEIISERKLTMSKLFSEVEKFIGKQLTLTGDFNPLRIELVHEVANRRTAWWFCPVKENGVRDGSKLGIIEPSDKVIE